MRVRGPVLALGVATIVGFGVSAIQPQFDHTQQDRQRTQQQQSDEQGADAVEIQNERNRENGEALNDADYRDRLRPGEYRPRIDLPDIRFRP